MEIYHQIIITAKAVFSSQWILDRGLNDSRISDKIQEFIRSQRTEFL